MPKRLLRPMRALNDDAIEAMNGLHTDWGALPNGGGMQAVVNLLRSEEPIRPDVRALLAELLDLKEGQSTWKLVAKRRQAGRPEPDIGRPHNIGRKIAAMMADGVNFESAVSEIAGEYKISRTSAAECLKRWRALEQRLAKDHSESN